MAAMPRMNHQVPIAAPPAAVYAALATEAGLRSWWTADVHADEAVSGKAEFGFDGRNGVFRMSIAALVPGKWVIWSCLGDRPAWAGTTLTWDIVKDGGGSVLRLTHAGWRWADISSPSAIPLGAS